MPRFNVELDGKWACYSGISDEFITPFMTLEEFEKWRDKEYGKESKKAHWKKQTELLSRKQFGKCVFIETMMT